MNRLLALFATAAVLALAALSPAGAAAAPAPAWSLRLFPMPASFESGKPAEYLALATNVGAAETSGTSTLTVTLPAGLTPLTAKAQNNDHGALSEPSCQIVGQEVSCQTAEPIGPGRRFLAALKVDVSAPEGTLVTAGTVSGGGAPADAQTSFPTEVASSPLGFDFLPGFASPLSEEDGQPTVLAGSHPYQQTLSLAFPTKRPKPVSITNDGHPRHLAIELPRGLLGNPAANPVLCTEAQLSAHECPDASQIGTLEVTSLLGEAGVNVVFTDNLYNMAPPPGSVAELGADINVAGLLVHILVGLRSDSDYGIEATTRDSLALGIQPIFAVQSQIWGDPSAAAHDGMRGDCVQIDDACPVLPAKAAFLTLPADCPGQPLPFAVGVDSWEEPSPPFAERVAGYESADLAGNPVAVEDCGALDFEPTISARPTTELADSPSGLDFELHQPQNTDLAPARASAPLKDVSVTFPEGLVVNPSQAAGLDACTQQQIGFAGEVEGNLRFTDQPQSCPDAAKIGSVEVTSPSLVARDENQEVELEEGEPVLEPMHGALYLAEPFQNPLDSLVAIYLAVEDERTGIVAKLVGEAQLNPQTGQITTRFEDNPQLPLEDLRVHLFGGERGALVTPPSCGGHTTSATLTPWSTPEGADVQASSTFQIAQQPGGGACPAAADQAPNGPLLSAGTLIPTAGAYSPFALRISREDGSQRLTGIDTLLPPGLTGKLAGVEQCSEAQIAQAAGRSHPEEGIVERESPSCPVSTQVGTVDVGAGAGPTPFHTQGTAYLAGPYKGAPLSLVVITPAVAGPFDLGTVVTRVALFVEPESAQIHAVSDPLPTILEGIPLDVRSVALKMDRPEFTINPTSCDPLSITGIATSAFGRQATLSQRFQVGGCEGLAFKPKLSLRLKGSVKRSSNPKLIANLTARPGETNIARAQVKLPGAVFLDQSHIRTICTRVQFAADACPAGSVYGKVRATTPLLGYPLAGSVYLRSSSHELPDLVAKLEGPASQPIEIDVVGKTDAVKGALRNTFEAVPDAPVSSFRLELFGGKRGLVEMSDGFCSARRATVKLDGQNGKTHDTHPVVGAKCTAKGKKKGGGKQHGKAHR